jgi:hypothetical protein
MPGNVNWGRGGGAELTLISTWFNEQSTASLARFEALIWDQRPSDLMDAFVVAFLGGGPSPLGAVANNWFGIGTPSLPMWLWDCTLGLSQMHEVMKETAARTCALVRTERAQGNFWPVELWVQCGHPRLRTIITWPGATTEDATLGTGPWAPANPTGAVRVWVFIPFNSGYAEGPYHPTPDEVIEAMDRRRVLIREIDGGSAPADVMTLRDVWTITNGYRENYLVWRGTPLAVQPDAARGISPATRAGLGITYLPAVLEPPRSSLSYERLAIDPRPQPSPGIEISWPGAAGGVLTDDSIVVTDPRDTGGYDPM